MTNGGGAAADVSRHQLAQLNIATMLESLDSPSMADFVANLDRINGLAEVAPGFVWRLVEDGAAANPFGDKVLVNMSVWESMEALQDFAFRSAHVDIMRRRRQWFHKMEQAFAVLWWVPAGHVPTTEEAAQRLAHLRQLGPTAEAFTFQASFPPPDNARDPFHAHIYYTAADRPAAQRLHDALQSGRGWGELADLLFVGVMTDRPVGPHPLPQYEVHCHRVALPMMLERIRASGLRALVHELTLDDPADHTSQAMWIGEPLDLDLTVLDPPGINQGIARFGKSDF